MPGIEPAYMTLFRSGELADRAREATAHLASCDLCARYCRVDRFQGVKGAVCRTAVRAMVHSFGPHFGEERCLTGTRGSGTIFFTWCNLRCVFCENYQSTIPNYVEVNQAAVREMYRQVGELTLDEHGIARRGLLVRHLVLPGALAGTEQILKFLSRELSPTISVNVMGQYQPYFKAAQYPALDRPLTVEEWQAAAATARHSGLPLVDGPAGDAAILRRALE